MSTEIVLPGNVHHAQESTRARVRCLSSVSSHETHTHNGYLEMTYQVTRSPAPGGQSGTDARGRGLSAGGTWHPASLGAGRGPLSLRPSGSRAAAPKTCLRRRPIFGGSQLFLEKRGLRPNKLRKHGVRPGLTGSVSTGLVRAFMTAVALVNGQHGGRLCSIPQGYLTTKPFSSKSVLQAGVRQGTRRKVLP